MRKLEALKRSEDALLRRRSEERAMAREAEAGGRAPAPGRRQGRRGLFAPLTTGVFLPALDPPRSGPIGLRKPYVSAFIESAASAQDLQRLGVRVRSQACNIFTAFIPMAVIPRLEASTAVSAIELARPLFPRVNQARAYAKINGLQTGPPPRTGANVVVGIVDTVLDVYHPDFCSAAGRSRVLWLWDQTLTPEAGESGPPALPGFGPPGGAAAGSTYGVEYSQADIDAELGHPAGVPAYRRVRHGGAVAAHGSHVTGIAAGNGRGRAARSYRGVATGANIIFVAYRGAPRTELFADSVFVADGIAYIFARAAALGQPCVVNLSLGDDQGPHDGTTAGERFLEGLLATPGRALTVAGGNATGAGGHASGTVAAGAAVDLVLTYLPPLPGEGHTSDDVEIWYDGHDRFDVTVTTPTGVVIGPRSPGDPPLRRVLPGGVEVTLTSVLNDPRNGDNVISIIMIVPTGQELTGNWDITLTGAQVINGRFHAWVDRNNRDFSLWQPPFVDDTQATVGLPGTCRSAITVGNHDTAGPPATIAMDSGVGPTRDGRIKPDLAAVGTDVTAPRSRDMNAAVPGALYWETGGTSMAAPLVAGVCALMYECRGPTATWADLLQILADTAGTSLNGAPAPPNSTFGAGFLQAASACTAAPRAVDVWLRDDPADTGLEPFTGPVAWLSPDIEVLDATGGPVPNPRHHPTNRFNSVIRVTVRNRGTRTARNTEAHLYWADPATNIPVSDWRAEGVYTGAPGFLSQGNRVVIPHILAGGSTRVEFAWAPPAPGSNLRGDDHFCLIVRLEHPADPAQVGGGGFPLIGQRNNVGLRNVHVLPNATGGSAETAFYVVGSAAHDSLVVTPDLVAGEVTIGLPAQALPWRDLRVLERSPGPRRPYHGAEREDPVARLRLTLEGREIPLRTGVAGAHRLELRDGIASIRVAAGQPLVVPCVHVAEAARMPVSLRVAGLDTNVRRRFVHVGQLSAGRRVGGVTLELRKGLRRDR